VAGVLDGTAPVVGYVTVIEAHLLAGLAHRELGDQRAASQAAEQALALAEADRLILPFAMTGSAGLLEALPRHQTAHAALLADILDVLHGASPAPRTSPHPRRPRSSARASCGCCGPADQLVPARDRRPAVGLARTPSTRTSAATAAGGIAALVYGLSAAAPSGAFDVSHWAGAKVIAALAGAEYHPGRRPTNQMRRCLH
jgi:hypothetical protein